MGDIREMIFVLYNYIMQNDKKWSWTIIGYVTRFTENILLRIKKLFDYFEQSFTLNVIRKEGSGLSVLTD